MKPRVARFDVTGIHLDGKKRATLTIEVGGTHEWARVRAHGSHAQYSIPLAIVVQMIADRAAKMGSGMMVATMAALLLTGCGLHRLEPVSENEILVVEETARFASQLGVNVRGVITDHLYDTGNGIATGWYSRGVAYYYRPLLSNLRPDIADGPEHVTNVAAHEVCHARHGHHDLAHWECSNRLAVATYPRP